jgi:hypothetical protein
MIVQISEIRIKLSEPIDFRITSRLFNDILANYIIDPESSFDFEVIISNQPSYSRNFCTLKKFHNTLYHENQDFSCFKNSTMQSTIDWVHHHMYLTFNSTAENLDRLYLEQLKLLISLLTVKRGGIPLHCSAVSHEKMGGIIFTGRSGAGKTTAAELLSRSCTVFNDEFNTLIPNGNKWSVHSTPFTNPYTFPTFPHNVAPLNMIFFLIQDSENKVIPVSFKRAYTALLENTYTLLTTTTTEAIMDNLESLVRSVPSFLLHFAISQTFENTILNPEHLFHACNKAE